MSRAQLDQLTELSTARCSHKFMSRGADVTKNALAANNKTRTEAGLGSDSRASHQSMRFLGYINDLFKHCGEVVVQDERFRIA